MGPGSKRMAYLLPIAGTKTHKNVWHDKAWQARCKPWICYGSCYVAHTEAVWIEDTCLREARSHHATICWDPCRVVPMTVPGCAHWITLRRNLLGLSSLDLYSDESISISLRLLRISSHVDPCTQHPSGGWSETVRNNWSGIGLACPMVHGHGLALPTMPTTWCLIRRFRLWGLTIYHHTGAVATLTLSCFQTSCTSQQKPKWTKQETTNYSSCDTMWS